MAEIPNLELASRQHRAAREWAELFERLRTVTPRAVGRAILTVAVAIGSVGLARATWPAIVPFLVGGVVAYGLLPVVDALDRVMPRLVASILSVTALAAAFAAVAFVVLPPLARAFVRLAADLPTAGDIDAAVARLQDQVGTLPEGSAGLILPVITALATAAREAIANGAAGLDDAVRSVIGALLNAVGALLGLIVLPAWMLSVMTDKRRARAAVDRELTPWIRRDASAVMAIVDRAAGAYLRGYIPRAALVGFLVYLGGAIAPSLGAQPFREPLALAVFAGACQVVPAVGPLLGFVPALLFVAVDPARSATYTVIYIASVVIGAAIGGSRLMERRIAVHPAIMVPGVVLVGQFGLGWLILSAPIVAMTVDFVRYAHGRLGDPPRPAGVLPHEPDVARAVTGQAAAPPRTRRRLQAGRVPAPLVVRRPSEALESPPSS